MPQQARVWLSVAVVILGLTVGGVRTAHAASIVVNGSFETGTFDGWTETGDTFFNGVQCPGPSPEVSDGNCSAFFGPVGTTGGITQTLPTVAGVLYDIRFDFLPDGGIPSFFQAQFAGIPLVTLSNPAASAFQSFFFQGIAIGPATVLSFDFRDDPGFLFLDNVSVDAAVAAVPEPASWSLLALGVAGMAAARRRAKR